MVLAFKEQFKQKILDGSKIHTIRRDLLNEIKINNKIEFVDENQENYFKPYKNSLCMNIQEIFIDCILLEIFVNKRRLPLQERNILIKNDGFDNVEDFFIFFIGNYGMSYSGKIIHWTDFKY